MHLHYILFLEIYLPAFFKSWCNSKFETRSYVFLVFFIAVTILWPRDEFSILQCSPFPNLQVASSNWFMIDPKSTFKFILTSFWSIYLLRERLLLHSALQTLTKIRWFFFSGWKAFKSCIDEISTIFKADALNCNYVRWQDKQNGCNGETILHC